MHLSTAANSNFFPRDVLLPKMISGSRAERADGLLSGIGFGSFYRLPVPRRSRRIDRKWPLHFRYTSARRHKGRHPRGRTSQGAGIPSTITYLRPTKNAFVVASPPETDPVIESQTGPRTGDYPKKFIVFRLRG